MEQETYRADQDRLDPKPPTILGIRRSALIEIALFLGVALIVDSLFLGGNRYWEVAPHPFWLIVLLVSVQYGSNEGLFAAAAASVALLLGNMPEHSLSQDAYGYLFTVTRHPLMWFLVSLLLGELRLRHIREREQLRHQLISALQREETIAASHQKISAAKEKLELRLATQMRSMIRAHQAAKAIEKLEPKEVLHGVMEVCRTVLNPDRFSLYLLKGDVLELSAQEGWSEADSYVRHFHPEAPIFREVIGRQRFLCCANEEDERTLQGEGLLAGPLLCGHTGEMLGMLKIEKLGFLDLNVSNVEAFRSLCDWVANTYANARRYQAAKAESLVNGETELYSYNYFKRQSDFLTALAKRFGFDLSLVILRLENGEELGPKRSSQIPMLVNRTVRKCLRKTDLLFDFQRTGFEFAFVLPGNSVENSQVLIDKLIADMKLRARDARFSATSLALHQAHPEVGNFVQELFPRPQEVLAKFATS